VSGEGAGTRIEQARRWFDRPDVRDRPQPPAGSFEIALALAGTVSTGAFTAGVLDYLMEALDEFGRISAEGKWQADSVSLRVVTGTSGGSVCASTFARALAHAFPPQAIDHGDEPVDALSRNPLYRVWVLGFDVQAMCAVPEQAEAPLRSLLHEGPRFDPFPQTVTETRVREWVAEPLTVLVTTTNLQGVAYRAVTAGNAVPTPTWKRHADCARFEICYGGASSPDGWPDAVRIDAGQAAAAGWQKLWDGARASSAFPLMFPSVPVARPAWNYLYQPNGSCLLTASVEAQDLVQVPCRTGEDSSLESDWHSGAVDGGLLTADPSELARRELEGVAPAAGHSPAPLRRAVITVDPLWKPVKTTAVDDSLAGVLRAIVNILLTASGGTQATSTGNRFERCAHLRIVPERVGDDGRVTGSAALAGSALSSFAGFLSSAYRHHDFMLGRRNCQQFLRAHFGPAPGATVAGSAMIIPLVGSAARDQPQPAWPVAGSASAPDAATDVAALQLPLVRRLAYVARAAWPSWKVRTLLALMLLLPATFATRKISEFAANRVMHWVRGGLIGRGLLDTPATDAQHPTPRLPDR